jgi:hypothetical protein
VGYLEEGDVEECTGRYALQDPVGNVLERKEHMHEYTGSIQSRSDIFI